MASVPPHRPKPVGRSVSVTLERHRHSHQLSPSAPPDEEQTLFVVQLRLGELGLDLVRKEVCTCVCAKITPVHLPSETTTRLDDFLNLTRMAQHSNCPSFWKFVRHQSSSVTFESSPTCWVDSRIRQRYFSFWILDRTCVKLCHCQDARILHQLSSVWKTRS